MIEEIVFDGEVHALSKDYAYISKRVYETECQKNLMEHVNEHLIKYCEYLYLNDKDKVINYLMSIFSKQVYNFCTDKNYKVIFTPPYLSSCLAQFATLSLKFERVKNDNLGNP